MRRRRALSIALLAGTSMASRRPVRAQALTSVRIVGPSSEASVPNYYALRSGMFERAGLDVKIYPIASGTAAAAAVVAGAYDVARSSIPPIFAAHLHGIPFTMVAGMNQYRPQNPSSLIQVASDSAIHTAADLNGKTVGVTGLDDISVVLLKAWVWKNGGDWRSLHFTEVPNPASVAAVTQHRVDAVAMQPPQVAASVAAGTTRTLCDPSTAVAPAYLTASFIARQDWADGHVDALRRLYRVMSAADEYVNAHPAETTPLLMELTGMDPTAVKDVRRSYNSTALDLNLIQPLIDTAATFGMIDRTFPAKEIVFSRAFN